MIIVGITFKPTHPSASIIVDGKIVGAIAEERFNRIKGGAKAFPINSINFCLDEAGVKPSDVDFVVGSFNYETLKKYYHDSYYISKSYRNITGFDGMASTSLYHNIDKEMKQNVKKVFGDDVKFSYVEHHFAHAASTYYSSGFDKSNIITIDGRGELSSTYMFTGNNEIEKVHEIKLPDSIGVLWQGVTMVLNWIPNQQEGKVMGLATYGKDKFYDIFKKHVELTEDGYKINFDFETFYNESLNSYFRKRENEYPINDYFEHIAYAMQKRTEDVMNHLIDLLVEQTGYKKLCLAGGVALNCSMNGEIIKRDDIEDIFIQPASSDDGASLGAAQYKYFLETGKKPEMMDNACTGKEYSNEEIENELKRFNLDFSRTDDIEGEVAERLNNGLIVSWFQGRCEYGPRALGARSVLGNPSIETMKKQINDHVKYREEWRPFALSMLDEAKDKYLINARSSRFMILKFDVKEDMINDLISGTHVDGSTRPQTVEKNILPRYHKMIKEFGKLSGVDAVINTSYNIKGEPLILRPIEAIRDFYASGANTLAIGDYLIDKKR